MTRRQIILLLVTASGAAALALTQGAEPRRWLAGDSHIHSHWSTGYDRSVDPPAPVKGGEGFYPTLMNAQKAREYGLSWMVTTDHGGPNHAKLNRDHAHAELQQARRAVPDLLQFYGMEFNMPAMDHHTLIVPFSDDEASVLFDIESGFDADEVWPPDPARDTEEAARRALEFISTRARLPLLFANHPSRTATGLGQYGLNHPRELRAHNDAAPEVYRGMEGAPGHQAAALAPDGTLRRDGASRPFGRGFYGRPGAHTLGGFDQMTAIVGGLWDSLLGEGRRFWIVATSDSHVNFAEPARRGSDFWPGQYQKTYVYARKTYDDVLDGLRNGRIFAVTGDLITELNLAAAGGRARAETGGTLAVPRGSRVTLTVRFRDPDTPNANGENPRVARVDVIIGEVRGPVADAATDRNETTRVLARFTRESWTRDDGVYTFTTGLPWADRAMYVRVRGTSTDEDEPAMDPPGENPWQDLWFYSNPIFIEAQ